MFLQLLKENGTLHNSDSHYHQISKVEQKSNSFQMEV